MSKTDEKYSTLYSVIGDYWNTSDSLTEDQFQLPDLRNCFLRGCPEYIENSEENRLVGNFQACGVPNITGWFNASQLHDNDVNFSGALYSPPDLGDNVNYTVGVSPDQSQTGIALDASRSSSVYQDGLTEVRPDNKAVNYIIKL